jgi:type II secretion system protein G
MESFFWLKSGSRRSTTSENGALWKGFTLIELLIVIAIILILISIALPNFLEAQMRAKVAKCKGEIRSITFALDSYFLDFKTYPAESEHDPYQRTRFSRGLLWLTSPIKYMSRIPEDPFTADRGSDGKGPFVYETGGIKAGIGSKCLQCLATWAIFTDGPDQEENQIVSAGPHVGVPADGSVDSYSPTNGTRSYGDIFQFGGDPFWIGVNSSNANRTQYKPSWDTGLVVDHEFFLHRLPPKLR